MAYTYKDLQDEVHRRAVKDQGGTQFTTAVKNIINTSLFRLANEAPWKPLRKKTTFSTEAELTSGTVSATNDSDSFTGSSLNLITNGVEIGRRINIQGSSLPFTIATITGENAFTCNLSYDGTTASGLTHTIFGKETYNLPIQSGRIGFLWHEEFGYPFVLRYVTDFEFYRSGREISQGDVPVFYRMWGADDVEEQPKEASVITISSSASGDTSINITVFGTVSNLPDFEIITTNGSDGTTAVAGSKSFTHIDRITKSASTTGRITVTANSANTTVATLPAGDIAGRTEYKKISLHPLPSTSFPVNVQYYKDPWRLVNDGDFHELGHQFDEAIILFSVSKLKAENSQEEFKSWFGMYKDEVKVLRRENTDKLDYIPQLQGERESSFTRGGLHPHLSFHQVGSKYGPGFRL